MPPSLLDVCGAHKRVVQFSWKSWCAPTRAMVIDEAELLASLRALQGEPVLGARLLGPKHGARVYKWFCRWHMLLMWGACTLVVANWFCDWVLPRHAEAQGVMDVLFAAWCFCLLSAALLSGRVSVMKRVVRQFSSLYFLFCGTMAWSMMLAWRGRSEGWLWWLKVVGLLMLSNHIVFIDALPLCMRDSLAGCSGSALLFLTCATHGAATYIWLKVHTADSYSENDIPEWTVGEFVSLSSYNQCCDLLFFQMLHSLYGGIRLWLHPQDAVFVMSSPIRDWR